MGASRTQQLVVAAAQGSPAIREAHRAGRDEMERDHTHASEARRSDSADLGPPFQARPAFLRDGRLNLGELERLWARPPSCTVLFMLCLLCTRFATEVLASDCSEHGTAHDPPAVRIEGSEPAKIEPGSGSSVARQRTWLGAKGSRVQIPAPRPTSSRLSSCQLGPSSRGVAWEPAGNDVGPRPEVRYQGAFLEELAWAQARGLRRFSDSTSAPCGPIGHRRR
jgi:hypothetical protein